MASEAGHDGNFEVVFLGKRAGLPADSKLEPSDIDYELVHYFHENDSRDRQWVGGQNIAFRGRSEKICQLTGGSDEETFQPTTNNTANRFNLGATDLGYPVDDDTALSLYFGDSRDSQLGGLPSEWGWDDAVGISTDTSPPTATNCLHIVVPMDSAAFAKLKVTQAMPTPLEPRFYQGLFQCAIQWLHGGNHYLRLFLD